MFKRDIFNIIWLYFLGVWNTFLREIILAHTQARRRYVLYTVLLKRTSLCWRVT